MLLSLVALAFGANPDLPKQWASVESAIRQHTNVPVPLSSDDLNALMAGEMVASRFDTDKGAYATGAAWLDVPIDRVWLAINDGEHDPPGRTTLRILEGPPNVRRVHLTLDLPFPISDRQWVADIVANKALYHATGGRVWQRQWALADKALATEADRAVWLKENRGAWTLVDTGDGTLMLFTVRTVLGGLLPPAITQAWAVKSLRRTFTEAGPRAKAMPEHYTGSHFLVQAPDGAAVPRWPR
ncbi:MAG: hypothetical protein AAGA48_30780 [Myxococcota bacterium]